MSWETECDGFDCFPPGQCKGRREVTESWSSHHHRHAESEAPTKGVSFWKQHHLCQDQKSQQIWANWFWHLPVHELCQGMQAQYLTEFIHLMHTTNSTRMYIMCHSKDYQLVPQMHVCLYVCVCMSHMYVTSYQMTELGIRQQIAGRPSWFEITKRKECYQLEVSLCAHWNCTNVCHQSEFLAHTGFVLYMLIWERLTCRHIGITWRQRERSWLGRHFQIIMSERGQLSAMLNFFVYMWASGYCPFQLLLSRPYFDVRSRACLQFDRTYLCQVHMYYRRFCSMSKLFHLSRSTKTWKRNVRPTHVTGNPIHDAESFRQMHNQFLQSWGSTPEVSIKDSAWLAQFSVRPDILLWLSIMS